MVAKIQHDKRCNQLSSGKRRKIERSGRVFGIALVVMLMPAVLLVLGAGRRFGLNRVRFRHVSLLCVAPGFSLPLFTFTIL